MAYIGREPQIGNFQICDAISVVDNSSSIHYASRYS
jgi:hypothetical protein